MVFVCLGLQVLKMAKSEKRYDMVLGSKELKKAVTGRITDNQINVYRLCERSGANYKRFQAWLNDTNPRDGGTLIINHEQLIATCTLLGIEPRLLVVMKKDFKVEKELKNKLF